MILNWNKSSVSRRRFLKQTAALTVVVACGTGLSEVAAPKRPDESFFQTVLGPVPNAEFGPALIHEHVMCEFIGAEIPRGRSGFAVGYERQNKRSVISEP